MTYNYSGIIAIFVYSFILFLILKFRKKKDVETVVTEDKPVAVNRAPLDLNDEDATVACLVAAIECRNEMKKNVQIVSVRRIA